MKNEDLILMLVDKSVNAFGELIGLSEYTKLKVALTIIQDTIKTAFGIDSFQLTQKTLEDILIKDLLDYDQRRLLTNLLWTQAEILLKLKTPIASLASYENALYLLRWTAQQSIEKNHLEKINKIAELETVIKTLNPTRNQLNYN